MVSEKDIEYEELGPGKGARITLTGETADKVITTAKERGIKPEDVIQGCIEAFIKDAHLRAEVIERLREKTGEQG